VAFLRDLEAKPSALRDLAGMLPASRWELPADAGRFVLIGMGSSRFAAMVAAGRLRAHGLDAVAEYASASVVAPGGPGTVAIGISAGGGTPETVGALRRHADAGSHVVAVTNDPSSEVVDAARTVVDLRAGVEAGGVACRTYVHTLAHLLALEAELVGRPSERVADTAVRAADALDSLLADRDDWLAETIDVVGSYGPVFLIAPVERIASAEQGALMLREGPRRPADACETGDWLHVDVYLTRPLDYRALLFTGSRFDADVMRWMTEREAEVVAVGREVPGGRLAIRYPGDDDRTMALLVETLVPELIAASLWLAP
jgi:glucosamine 6-phosphate synthetase-like amidotransferase/phosphosugar isomerase protein